MKICIVSETYIGHPNASGGQYSAHVLAKALTKKGHEIHVLTSNYEGGLIEETVEGVHVHRRLDAKYGLSNKKKGILFNIYKNEFFYLHSKNVLKNFIKNNSVDILQAHNITSLYSVSKVAKKYHIPSTAIINSQDITCPQQVLHIRKGMFCDDCNVIKMFGCTKNNWIKQVLLTIYNYYTFLFTRYHARNIDYLFATCNDLKKRLENTGISVIDVIYNIPWDYKQGNALDFRMQYKLNQSFVLFVTSFLSDASKGYKQFIEIVKLCPEIHFVCVGTQDIRPVNLINVSYVGKLSQDMLSNAYSASTVVILPSTVPDALPRVGLEALSVGKPLVGTRIGGIPELIKENINGYLVELNNSNEFANKLRVIMNFRTLQEQFGKASQQILRDNFRQDLTLSKLLNHYGELRKIKCA